MGFERQHMVEMVHQIQDEITEAITEVDGMQFSEDVWERPGGGGGRSRVLQDGNVFENIMLLTWSFKNPKN